MIMRSKIVFHEIESLNNLSTFDLMIVLVTKKLFMRSKVKNYVFWTFNLMIVLVTKKLFMRLKVKNNVFWTFDLMKNAAIRRLNHYCNFQSNEKWKKISISWLKKTFYLMKFGLLTPSRQMWCTLFHGKRKFGSYCHSLCDCK
jgi:hypothetical protein